MDITYLGHSAFRIKGKSASIITDPFDPSMVGLKFPKNTADIVTISHQHPDHNYWQGVGEVKRIVDGPGEYEIAGVSIIGIPTYHDDKKGESRGKNTIFIYEIDNLRLCHLGDLGHELSEKASEEMGDVDIVMIPVGDEYTIGPSQAVSVLQAIDAPIAIPMHYQTEGLKPETFAKLKPLDTFLTESGMVIEKLDKLSVKYGEINEEAKKIVVLERKI